MGEGIDSGTDAGGCIAGLVGEDSETVIWL